MKTSTKSQVKPISIYKVTNKVNGKCYIGQTCGSVDRRFSQHCYDANKNKKKNPFHSAIRKYGKENFSHDLILVCNDAMSNYYENAIMNLYDSHISNGKGYNAAMPLDHFRSISTSAFCEEHGNAKLTNYDVKSIIDDVTLSTSCAAKKYNVSTGTIKKIRYGDAWGRVGIQKKPVGSYKKNNKSGEDHHACVISDEIRIIIKNDFTTNTSTLAKRYGIDKSNVSSIRGAQKSIAKLRVISDDVAQYALDNPEVANSVLSKKLNISGATISRIKTGKQFPHLVSSATQDQWDIFFLKQKKATGKLFKD